MVMVTLITTQIREALNGVTLQVDREGREGMLQCREEERHEKCRLRSTKTWRRVWVIIQWLTKRQALDKE